MYRPRIKICGITRAEDALNAAYLGADAVGLVFYAKSPRAVSPEQAARIINGLPPFVSTVGLFVNAAAAEVDAVLSRVPLDILQFHGDETAEYCAAFSRPYFKAIRMKPETDLLQQANIYAAARALLLDAYVPGIPGGTGHTFDWTCIPANFHMPLIVAGGLDADNVTRVVGTVQPWAVDVSGGVEVAKGIKDARKIRDFMAACQTP
jgi:phosphoribosylanthranilate isomerase